MLRVKLEEKDWRLWLNTVNRNINVINVLVDIGGHFDNLDGFCRTASDINRRARNRGDRLAYEYRMYDCLCGTCIYHHWAAELWPDITESISIGSTSRRVHMCCNPRLTDKVGTFLQSSNLDYFVDKYGLIFGDKMFLLQEFSRFASVGCGLIKKERIKRYRYSLEL